MHLESLSKGILSDEDIFSSDAKGQNKNANRRYKAVWESICVKSTHAAIQVWLGTAATMAEIRAMPVKDEAGNRVEAKVKEREAMAREVADGKWTLNGHMLPSAIDPEAEILKGNVQYAGATRKQYTSSFSFASSMGKWLADSIRRDNADYIRRLSERKGEDGKAYRTTAADLDVFRDMIRKAYSPIAPETAPDGTVNYICTFADLQKAYRDGKPRKVDDRTELQKLTEKLEQADVKFLDSLKLWLDAELNKRHTAITDANDATSALDELEDEDA
jgi:hypothetical protein